MEILNAKQQNEQTVFTRFIARLDTRNDWLDVSSRQEPEPDLLCVHSTNGAIAFELVSLTDPNIAKVQAAGAKAFQNAFSTSDPSERIIRNKLQKTYNTDACHIELLVYTDGQILLPDNALIPTIRPLFDEVSHPFQRVWFMGEVETFCLWDAS